MWVPRAGWAWHWYVYLTHALLCCVRKKRYVINSVEGL